MNRSDRASFDAFCLALQSFPFRLAERPGPHYKAFINGQSRGKAFVNTRRLNFWSVVHISATRPPHALEGAEIAALKPAEQVIIHRFQLRYADIPIEPVIEVVEPLTSPTAEPGSEKSLTDGDIDVRGFNKRVADAARAVLGGAASEKRGIVGHANLNRRRSIPWRPSLW